jgi:rhamnose utilization protein RhaD (predicted bifunctional aldolase and dehydrogenase)
MEPTAGCDPPDEEWIAGGRGRHTHPEAVTSILCTQRAREFAENRIVPDEIVCCGSASVLVPYVDPGLALARETRARTRAFMDRYRVVPRIVLMENHGIVALGRTPEAVLAGTLMAEKAARIFLGAAALGGPRFLTAADARSIAERSDEHYRQRVLNL